MNGGLADLVVSPDATLRDALAAIDRGSSGAAFVCESSQRLVGVVTDGDIRRALLVGADLSDSITRHVTRVPLTVSPEAGRAEVLDLMQAHQISLIPVIDGDRCLRGMHTLREVIGGAERPNWAVVMAGGRGTRLRPLTDDLPKPMVEVAGRPILERILLHLVGGGIRRVFFSVNYKAELIEDYFGDGSSYGCRIEYLKEPKPLGTAGSLALLGELTGEATHPLLVMNGDLVCQFSIEDLLRHHELSGAEATVAVREYVQEVPYGVTNVGEDGCLLGLEEKPLMTSLINAGIYVFEPQLVASVRVEPLDITTLLKRRLTEGAPVATWKLNEDWVDVGMPKELGMARGDW